MNNDIEQQVQTVLEARQALKDYVKTYGRNSAGAADRRKRLKEAESALLEMTIAAFSKTTA